MGGGTHYQVEYSFIMIDPLKRGYKIRREGQKQRGWEKDIREKKGVHSLGTRKSSGFDKGARLFEIILGRARSKAI